MLGGFKRTLSSYVQNKTYNAAVLINRFLVMVPQNAHPQPRALGSLRELFEMSEPLATLHII